MPKTSEVSSSTVNKEKLINYSRYKILLSLTHWQPVFNLLPPVGRRMKRSVGENKKVNCDKHENSNNFNYFIKFFAVLGNC